jgi:hypothetical protein
VDTVDKERHMDFPVVRFFETKLTLLTRYLSRYSGCWTDNRGAPVNTCCFVCKNVRTTKVLKRFLLEAIVNADEQLHVAQSLQLT